MRSPATEAAMARRAADMRAHRRAVVAALVLLASAVGSWVATTCEPSEALAAAATAGPPRPDQAATLSQTDLGRAYDYYNCGDDLVMCVDVKGNLLSGPRKPDGGPRSKSLPRPASGDQMVLRVLGHKEALAGKTLKLTGPGPSTKAEQKFDSVPAADAGPTSEERVGESAAASGTAFANVAATNADEVKADETARKTAEADAGGTKGHDAIVAASAVASRAADEAKANRLVAEGHLAQSQAETAALKASVVAPSAASAPTAAQTDADGGDCGQDALCWAGHAKAQSAIAAESARLADAQRAQLKAQPTVDAGALLNGIGDQVKKAQLAAMTASTSSSKAVAAAQVVADAGADASSSLVSDGGTTDGGAGGSSGDGEDLQRFLLASLNILTPEAPSFVIECRMQGATAADPETACGTYVINIDSLAPYHFEVMLSIPLIFGGERNVGLSPLAGTNQSVLNTTNDLEISTAIGLHYFPFGVRGGGAWVEAPNALARSSSVPVPLRALFHYLVQPWGLEVGTAINRELFKNVQVGLAFEPVRGGSISFGVAALQGQFYQPGWSNGMIYPAGTPLPVETRFMFRPYLGFSVSPEILKLVLDVLQQAQRISPPAGRAPDGNGKGT